MANLRKNLTLYGAILYRFKSQREFAQTLGKHESFVSRVVNGRENLSNEEEKEWADLLGRKKEDLFPTEGETFPLDKPDHSDLPFA